MQRWGLFQALAVQQRRAHSQTLPDKPGPSRPLESVPGEHASSSSLTAQSDAGLPRRLLEHQSEDHASSSSLAAQSDLEAAAGSGTVVLDMPHIDGLQVTPLQSEQKSDVELGNARKQN